MTQAITGINAVFRKYDTVAAAWVAMGEVTNISGPTMSRAVIDVTSLASTGGYREFIAGLRDPGGVTFEMFFVREDYDQMKADFESDTIQNYEIILADTENTTFEFEGLVTELPIDIPEEVVKANVTIKVSGEVTVNSGTYSGAPA